MCRALPAGKIPEMGRKKSSTKNNDNLQGIQIGPGDFDSGFSFAIWAIG